MKAYLHGIGAEESDLCDECKQTETVKHFLLDCKRWKVEKKEPRDAVRDKSEWGDMPHLLGGWSGQKDPRGRLIDREAPRWKPDWE